MEKLITMTNKETRRYDIIIDLINNKIDGTQASKQLNLSVRQTKRLKAKVKERGIKGIIHGNRGRKSNHQINEQEKEIIAKIIEENYYDFSS
jgi:transposase